ncbi:NUDIX hydrolase [Arcanobacterium haemolyticum]|uniref:NUDIX hydrolase n=1 Tax=Arcanobacterium haemolyticum (strain ATCC 9345 / DSM 20595 / CCM 5947 / CCUG 17215 / LMG 16163 / NBRC 15585 / NCTC 8452 / 11018) TaxID=644284 RepID=D7BP12_ARCHD|nr:NUDIX hydrolase [Arcanobacterium haemolyticum]ADH92661.1 NUDIX hydrolase [Arcanobacterium haemolyticum DSM 20595]QCX46771.1 NUDIX hydrolase [Arcanobacterium haemolyticum]SQH28602.1 ADP-ribose pyrophosphatase [Arcanobacterium haemolyticum]
MSTYRTVLGEIALEDVSVPDHVKVLSSTHEYSSPVFEVWNDQLEFDSGDRAFRQYMDHDDAVGIVAIRPHGDSWDVLLINQYRHAPRQMMWEIPAGLCDVAGEDKRVAAARELAEETGYEAGQWTELVDFHASAGVSNEKITIFLAEDVREATAVEFERMEEEREITVHWVNIDDVMDAIFSRHISCPTLVVGVLAAMFYVKKRG